jgi:hypothetical protein
MKMGKTLVELATEIARRSETKLDLVADTRKMGMTDEAEMVVNAQEFGVRSLAHQQIGTYYGINKPYYDKMLHDAPKLLAQNINHWLDKAPATRLVRTLDGDMRAFLSDSYRPLENEDLLGAILPVIMDMGLLIMSCEVTDNRLYVKAVDRRIERDVTSGRMGDGGHCIFDTCSPAIVVSNSEVGAGCLRVESGVWTRACTNMASWTKDGMRKRHLGARNELTEGLTHLLTDETKKATDRAVWMQVRDVVKGAFDEARFDARVLQLSAMSGDKIPDTAITKTVEATVKRFGLGEGEGKAVLANLIRGGDLSRYGLFNAVTRTAEDLADYDRASEIEQLGGKIVDLAPSAWRELTRVAA